jgi:hypothetical protein
MDFSKAPGLDTYYLLSSYSSSITNCQKPKLHFNSSAGISLRPGLSNDEAHVTDSPLRVLSAPNGLHSCSCPLQGGRLNEFPVIWDTRIISFSVSRYGNRFRRRNTIARQVLRPWELECESEVKWTVLADDRRPLYETYHILEYGSPCRLLSCQTFSEYLVYGHAYEFVTVNDPKHKSSGPR